MIRIHQFRILAPVAIAGMMLIACADRRPASSGQGVSAAVLPGAEVLIDDPHIKKAYLGI